MRGPRVRGRSDSASASELFLVWGDCDCGKAEVAAVTTVDAGTAGDRGWAALPLM